jgi:TonB-linked SusC/RagA family outer membrane protein
MNKKLLSLVLLFLCATFAFAQSNVIKGKVTDKKDGSPLPGVSVIAKGASLRGTQTDLNGLFTIDVPAGTKELTFKYVGYKEVNLPIVGNTMNVQLEGDEKLLNEVIVVGYGTQKRANITGAIATISGKDVEDKPVTSFEQALQGISPGVNIQADNGKLGQGIKISIRGAASITGSNQPLIVIDGIVINNDNLSNTSAPTDALADINFNDIESYEILKDASATAIYGSRASNGVILITTKKGKASTAKINFNAYYGSSEPSRHRQFLNTTQWLQIEERAAQGAATQDFNNGFFSSYSDALASDQGYVEGKFTALAAGNTNWNTYNTNWESQAFQSAPQQSYDLNFSGGTDKTTYYIGGQALNQTGILKGNSFQRYSGRVNVDTKITSNFDVGMNLNFVHTYNQRLSDDDAFSTPLQIVALSPITPIIDPRTGLISGTPPGQSSNYPLYYNPLISVDNAYYHTNVFHTIGNVFGNWEIVKYLSFKTEFGIDQSNQNEDSYFNSLTARNTGTPNGQGENSGTTLVHYTVNNYFIYKNIFAKDNAIDFTIGNSYEYRSLTYNDIQGQQFPSDSYKQISSAAVKSSGFSKFSDLSLISYFAKLNYAYKSKYLITLSARSDGSSNFGANNRYGYFPAASAGWILSNEEFLKNQPIISNLKVRASYGLTGNNAISDYGTLGLFSGDASYNGIAGQRFYQLENPNLKWEKTLQLDLGLDWGLFNNRISGGFDYYRKNTNDLLLKVNIPQTLGLGTQLQNLGKLYNQGFEVTISSENFVGKKFKWSTNINAAYNKNVVTYVGGQIISDDLKNSDLNRVIEGQPIGVFYGREYAGVNPANGDALYYLNTKNADGSLNRATTNDYNAAQNVPLGNPTPTFTGGITNNFSYAGFDLSFTFYGSFGNKIYNGGGQYMSANASNGFDNQTVDQLNYWNKPGDITNIPEPRLFYANGTNPSSRYLSYGSYIRLKTLGFGYNVPKKLLEKVKIDRLRIYMNAYNLFIVTKYTGWDPEVNADFQASNINLGVDFYSAPQPRTITFGLSVGL